MVGDPFTMVVLIVLITVGAGVVNNYFKGKANRAGDAETEAELHAMRAELDQVKERVRVLEKLATDGDRRLSEEISRLA